MWNSIVCVSIIRLGKDVIASSPDTCNFFFLLVAKVCGSSEKKHFDKITHGPVCHARAWKQECLIWPSTPPFFSPPPPTIPSTHTALAFRLHSGAFILTRMSVLCLSKMCSASPVFPLQIGSQIKFGSTGSGAYKHTRQAEWLVVTFQTFATTPLPKSGLCGQNN